MAQTHIKKHLPNVSFVIPVSIDSYERGRNLDFLLDYLTYNFDSAIYILEAGKQQQYVLKNMSPQITYSFVKDERIVFQHTLYLNLLYQLVETPILVGCDTDALVPIKQILDVIKQIEEKKAVMGLPYNGYMMKTEPRHVKMYELTRDLDVLEQNIHFMYPMYGSLSVGGMFIVNTTEYLRCGGENEHFLGWGPEDFERVKRMEILYPEYPIYRASGYLYHLWHPRLINSWYANEEYELIGKKEYIKICEMTTDELRSYINTWPWIKNRRLN